MTAPSPRSRTVFDAVIGIAAALLVFGAVPGVLIAFVGLPFPREWNAHAIVSLGALFDLLALVSWCAWAACAWPILRSVALRMRTRDAAPPVRLSDRVALRIAVGLFAVSSLVGLGASVGSSAAGASVRPTSPVKPVLVAVPRLPGGADPRGVEPASGSGHLTQEHFASCVVAPGDHLGSLAFAHYGDASAWTAIAAANLGRVMSDGARFVDPTHIAPGWNLALPALDADSSPVTSSGSGGSPSGGSPSGGSPSGGSGEPPLVLAELAAAGVSALVAGLLARRSRQLRRLRAFLRDEGEETPVAEEDEADLGVLIAPFEQLPLLELIETAACDLGGALATLGAQPGPVQWLRAGPDGVEVRFDDPVPNEVRGWRRTSSSSWVLPSTVDIAALARRMERREPWQAALLPLGDDERGTWILPLGVGRCVSLIGPRATELAQAMRAALGTWTWHESLLVTDDAAEAASAAGTPEREARSRPIAEVVFVGDPQELPADTRRACAVVTTRQVDGADVTVVVDARAASAHPLGLTVRPPLLSSTWTRAVDALGDPEVPDGRSTTMPLVRRTPPPAVVHVDPVANDTRQSDDANDVGGGGDGGDGGGSAAPALFAGPITSSASRPPLRPGVSGRGRAEVRLLGTVPGIVGLQGELPPKRARRAVELVAYLAMHAPDPVTGDRLRTRVLGTSDADAAAKTLFNTAGAARRALGTGPDGELLLPPASRSGHYRLSPGVTVDAVRMCALLREGLDAQDAAGSVARLREGLELVRGEPLAGVLTGYAWWRAEGHERRVADAVVDGACALVRFALVSDDIDLARWALGQARRVESYSEALTRSAMRVAAASGDARRLHAEWEACRRQMDELDPGGVPSERTEQLYALLRAQLAGDGGPLRDQASLAAIDAAPLRTVPSAPSTV